MGAPSRRARKIRTATEFDVRRLTALLSTATDGRQPLYGWTIEQIVAARDAQMRGDFRLPARMAEAMRTDDALHVAYENRLAPQRCIRSTIVPAKGARAKSVALEAEALFGQDGVGVSPGTLADVNGCLVNHGIAIGYNVATVRADGSRIDLEMRYWPIEFVRWDQSRHVLLARIDRSTMPDGEIDPKTQPGFSGFEVPIVHGDGRWVVFAKHEDQPWTQEAALLAAAVVWSRHAFAGRDWSRSSTVHGQGKLIGEMPPNVPLQNPDGALTPEAQAFATLLVSLVTGDSLAGIRPAGAKTDWVASESAAWQVFSELVLNAEKAAARIYLGTDGTLGAQGGAPGVDVTALFGVAGTKVEGDLRCIERAFKTGVIEVWCALNFGDSTLAPSRVYEIPDGDEDARTVSLRQRQEAFHAVIERMRANGFIVDQSVVDELAERFNVEPPTLPTETTRAPTIALAPTDLARVVSVNEARASAGLGPLQRAGELDPDGELTVEEYAARKAAAAAAPPVAP